MHHLLFLLVFVLLGCSRTTAPVSVAHADEVVDVPEPSGAEREGTALEREHGDVVIPVTHADPQWGQADALVTIVEFADFQCPFCNRVSATLEQIKDTYGPDQVRIVWKHNPLPFHKEARPAHEAAATVHALAGSDAFWKFHDSALANQRELNDANIEKFAAEAGADINKFREAYRAKTYAAKVDADMALSQKVGATGTPAFRINGVTLAGAQPFEVFKTVIDAQVEEAGALVAAGMKRGDVYAALVKKNFQPPEPKPPQEQPPGTLEDESTVWKVPVFEDDPTRGPRDALVTIVEFGNFQCPFCRRVTATLQAIEKRYGPDVRIVWKDHPLPFHARARPAANFAHFVYQQKGDNGFWDAHERLFATQPNLEDAALEKISGDLGLPWAQVKQAIDDDTFGDKIAASIELAMDLNARGIPYFFINGCRLSGAQPYERFEQLVEQRLADARARVASGLARTALYETIVREGKSPPPPEQKSVPPPGPQSPWKGARRPKVVIQHFGDFQCPFCARVQPTLEQILASYPTQVRVVWRHLPLDFHQEARLAGEAAQEVFAQRGPGAFWKYHDALFANQQDLSRPELERHAQALGVNMTRFRSALDSRKHRPLVERDINVARDAEIRGTPGFTVNGYFISGAQPYDAFDKLIRFALKAQR
jgi:protein-disulfide isomerase